MAIATAGLNGGESVWARLNRYSDLMLAGAVCAVVGMMIVPLPEWLLDLLIITNLSLGLVMLMVAVYARDALQFSVFPSLLLLTTLFRLGLDISATRLDPASADGETEPGCCAWGEKKRASGDCAGSC